MLSRLNHHLVRGEFQATHSSEVVVHINVRLAITLILLADSFYHEQMMCWVLVGLGYSRYSSKR